VGRIIFKLDELELENVGEVPEDKIMNLDIGGSERLSEGEPTCRVCYEPEKSDDVLVSPCGCIGSNKYIHFSCLKEWVNVKLKKLKGEGGSSSGQIYYL
jgi:hypothetical protein